MSAKLGRVEGFPLNGVGIGGSLNVMFMLSRRTTRGVPLSSHACVVVFKLETLQCAAG